jgi:hypothetical protein
METGLYYSYTPFKVQSFFFFSSFSFFAFFPLLQLTFLLPYFVLFFVLLFYVPSSPTVTDSYFISFLFLSTFRSFAAASFPFPSPSSTSFSPLSSTSSFFSPPEVMNQTSAKQY